MFFLLEISLSIRPYRKKKKLPPYEQFLYQHYQLSNDQHTIPSQNLYGRNKEVPVQYNASHVPTNALFLEPPNNRNYLR